MSPTHSYPRGGKWDFVEDMPRIEDISSLTNRCREADDSTELYWMIYSGEIKLICAE